MSRSKRVFIVAALAVLVPSLSGCGKQGFVPTTTAQAQGAPGTLSVPPKVDILLVEDDTGSISEAYPQISSQFPAFLQQLQSQGWDWHFATIPLTSDRVMNQVTASAYDSNWGSQWTPAYPGEPANSPDMVNSSVFVLPSSYTAFISPQDINYGENGLEPGFANMIYELQNQVPGTGFMRPDAMLVILDVGNGDDTSGVTYCTRSDGVTVPYTQGQLCSGGCTMNGQPAACQDTAASSFNSYEAQFQALKSGAGSVTYIAAVAAEQTEGCQGSTSYVGERYMQMAQALGGQSIDICNNSISSVISALSGSLQATQLSFETKYLVINQQPDVSTIVVTRYIGGNTGNAVTIPQDPNNGWTYDGLLQNFYTIDAPYPMNFISSGYAIELHGSAKLTGGDTANVTYQVAGTTPSGG